MTDAERDALIERLVRASGDDGYLVEARRWPEAQLVSTVAEVEATAAEVRRHGHLGAVWRADARDAAELARRA